jgi:hypothetical protein
MKSTCGELELPVAQFRAFMEDTKGAETENTLQTTPTLNT